MNKLGIIIPTELEYNLIKKYLQEDILTVVISDIGKVDASIAASRLIKNYGCDAILLYGFAGGLRGLEPGESIEPSEYIEGDMHAEELGYHYPNSLTSKHKMGGFRRVPIVSQDRFLSDDIYEQTIIVPVLACDMEAYSVAKTCQAYSVPFYCVKVISDVCDSEAVGKFLKPSDDIELIFKNTFRRTLQSLASL